MHHFLARLTAYLKNLLIALDQLLGVLLFNNDPDMTISAQAWLWHLQGKRDWPYRLIDGLFWFDPDHCHASYLSELKRLQLPEELRKE